MTKNQINYLNIKRMHARSSEASINHYRALFHRMEESRFDEENITQNSVYKLFAHMTKRGVSASTLRFYSKLLHSYFGYLKSIGYKDYRDLLWKISTPKRLPSAFTEKQIQDILRACDPGLQEVFIFLLSTGLRRSEAIRVSEADKTNGYIRVIGKGNKERLVPCSLKVPIMTKFTLERLMRRMKRVRKTARLHDCRHTYAVTLVENNIDLRTVQSLLGHSSLNTTAIYLHFDIARAKKQIEGIDFTKKSSPGGEATDRHTTTSSYDSMAVHTV